jgi:hypothetical protein
LRATVKENGKIGLSGSFGVFYSGHLIARLYDEHGHAVAATPVAEVNPTESVSLDTEITSPAKCARLSLHLVDETGMDRGALQEVQLSTQDNH